MIRGCIESVTPQKVRGWIHAEGRSLRDMPLLAFAGRECIGAGQVAIFRKDLADAGLGDGYLGFEIPISGERAEDLASVVVRLDHSDALLIQPEARVIGGQPGPGRVGPEQVRQDLARYRWMLSQGWIDQADYDFLKSVASRGVYELALPKAQRVVSGLPQQFNEIARRMLSLLTCQDVEIRLQRIATLEDLQAQAGELCASQARPVVALCGGSLSLVLTEGGHSQLADGAAGVMQVECVIGNYQMLFVDLRCPIGQLELRGCDEFTLLTA